MGTTCRLCLVSPQLLTITQLFNFIVFDCSGHSQILHTKAHIALCICYLVMGAFPLKIPYNMSQRAYFVSSGG